MLKMIAWIMAVGGIVGMIYGGFYILFPGNTEFYSLIIIILSLILFVISLEIFQRIKGKRLSIKDIIIIVLITPLLVFLFNFSLFLFMWRG